MTTTEQVNDHVNGHYQVFIRVQALMMTIAYIMVTTPEWFSLQDVNMFATKVLAFLFQTFSGEIAPVTFYVTVFGQTMQRFSEGVRNTRTLGNMVRETAGWEHLWTSYRAEKRQADTGAVGIPDPSNKTLDEINRWKARYSELQSRFDKTLSQSKKAGVQIDLRPRMTMDSVVQGREHVRAPALQPPADGKSMNLHANN